MTDYPPTPSELKARNKAAKRKPKKAVAKCGSCAGTGEVTAPDRRASRCPDCFGSGIGRQSEDGKARAFVFGAGPG